MDADRVLVLDSGKVRCAAATDYGLLVRPSFLALYLYLILAGCRIRLAFGASGSRTPSGDRLAEGEYGRFCGTCAWDRQRDRRVTR